MGRINIAEIRRRQIVDAAIRVMARKGWNETSIDEITREAGVSRGLVSYHFKDKAELLSGVLARCQEASNASIARSVEVSSDPVEQLRSAVRTALQLTREDPAIYEIFLHFVASGRSDPYLAEQIRELYRGFRKVTAAAIRNGQATGDFRCDVDPAAAAARHIGSLTGFAIQWLLDPGSFDFEAAAAQTEEMLVSFLTTGTRRRPGTEQEAVPA